MNHLRGLSAFTLTPFNHAGIVNVDHLQTLVSRLAATGVDSIGVLGSTGSYMYLNSVQRARAIEAAVEASNGTPVLAGIGDLRTDRVVEHAASAKKSGASALLLAPVSYLPLTDRDFIELVKTIASGNDLPLCLYNNPGTTHFTMSHELVCTLASLPTVHGVKNAAPATAMSEKDMVAKRQELPKDFVLGFSNDAKIVNVLPAGADAWYSVVAGTLPELALKIWSARGDSKQLEVVQSQCAPLWECFAQWGSIRVVPEIARMTGLGEVNLALPLQPLGNDAVAQIEKTLQSLHDSDLVGKSL